MSSPCRGTGSSRRPPGSTMPRRAGTRARDRRSDEDGDAERRQRRLPMWKLEVQDDRGIWSDVRGADGAVLTFDDEGTARAKLSELYPVLVKMEKYGDPKRT